MRLTPQQNTSFSVDKSDLKEPAAQAPAPSGAPSDRGGRPQGRGRGRGDASRGARGAAPSRLTPQEMTASGPFAMGPSQASSSAWLSGPRVSAAPTAPRGPADAAALGANLSKTAAPTLKKERTERRVHVDEDAEVYSDPDDGVEIVDMRDVHAMDWMAPESLEWERAREGSKKKVVKVKVEKEGEERASVKGKGAHPSLVVRIFGAMLTLTPSHDEKPSRRRWRWMGHRLWMMQGTSMLPTPWTSAKVKRKKRWKTSSMTSRGRER